MTVHLEKHYNSSTHINVTLHYNDVLSLKKNVFLVITGFEHIFSFENYDKI